MTSALYMLLEVCGRVVAFTQVHPVADAGELPVLREFQHLAARLLALEAEQRHAGSVRRASTLERRELRAGIHQHLQHLVAVARGVYRDQPEQPVRFQLPDTKRRHQEIISMAQDMNEQAMAEHDRFLRHGLQPGCCEQLAAQLVEYERIRSDGAMALADRRSATVEMQRVRKALMERLHQLDGVIRYRFRDRPEILAAWESARNIPWPRVSRRGEAGTEVA